MMKSLPLQALSLSFLLVGLFGGCSAEKEQVLRQRMSSSYRGHPHHHDDRRQLLVFNEGDLAVTYAAQTAFVGSFGCTRFPREIAYTLQCGGNGKVVALNDAENLDMAKCQEITDNDNRSGGGGRGTPVLRCVEPSVAFGESSSTNGVIFQCVGQSEQDWQATIHVEPASNDDANFDCSASILGAEYPFWTLSLSTVCGTPTDLITIPGLHNVEGTCTGVSTPMLTGVSDVLPTLRFCQALAGCGGTTGTPCGPALPVPPLDMVASLPPISRDACLKQPPTSVSRKPLASVVDPPRQALYAVQSILFSGGLPGVTDPKDTCALASPTRSIAVCGTTMYGENGQIQQDLSGYIVFVNEDGTEIPDAETGCTRVNDSTLECLTDMSVVSVRTGGSTGWIACIGETLQEVALTVRWEPGTMMCTAGENGSATFSVDYFMSVHQLCPFISWPDFPAPFNTYATYPPLAMDCAPVTSHVYDQIFTEITDKFTGEVLETLTTEIEVCGRRAVNCRRRPGLCPNGVMTLGALQARILPELLQENCLMDPVRQVAISLPRDQQPPPTTPPAMDRPSGTSSGGGVRPSSTPPTMDRTSGSSSGLRVSCVSGYLISSFIISLPFLFDRI